MGCRVLGWTWRPGTIFIFTGRCLLGFWATALDSHHDRRFRPWGVWGGGGRFLWGGGLGHLGQSWASLAQGLQVFEGFFGLEGWSQDRSRPLLGSRFWGCWRVFGSGRLPQTKRRLQGVLMKRRIVGVPPCKSKAQP